MAAPRKVVIDIVGDSKGYSKAAGDAIKTSESMASRVKSIGKGIPSAMLGGLGVGAGIGVFGLITGAIGSVTDALGDAVEAAKEDQAAQARTNTMLQANIKGWDGNTAAIEAAISAGARLAFTDDDIRDGLNELVPRTHDLNEALKLNSLAMDLARAKGMSLEEAASLVGKAYSGQVGALRRAGLAVSANLKPTEALAQLQKQVAGQAKTYANTAAGSAEAVQIQISEAMESIGYALIPVVSSLTSFAADTIPVVIGRLGELGKSFNDLHRFIDPNLAELQDLEAAVRAEAVAQGLNADALWASVKASKAQQMQDEELARVKDRLINQFGMSEEAADKEARAQLALGNSYEEGSGTAEDMAGSIASVTSAQKEAERYTASYRQQLDGIVTAFNDAASASGDYTGVTYDQFKLLRANKDMLLAEFATLPKVIQDAMVEAGLAVAAGADDMAAGADDAAIALNRLKHSGKTVAPGIRTDLSPIAGIVKGTLAKAKTEAIAGMADLNWALKHPMQGEKLERFYENRLDAAYKKLHQAQRTGNVIAIAKAQALIDGLRSKLNELRSVRISIQTTLDNRAEHGANSRGFEYRASGGPVKKGQPYIVGDGGVPEVFVPETNGTILPRVPASGNRSAAAVGGNTTVVVNVNVGPTADLAAVGREITRALRAFSDTGGGPALKSAVGLGR